MSALLEDRASDKGFTPSFGWLSSWRNEIYGACALWIVGLHAASLFGFDLSFGMEVLKPVDWFFRQNLGVDVFIFLAGISCYYSYSKNPDVSSFISKRIARIYPALLFTFGVSWFISVVLGRNSILWFAWHMTPFPLLTEGNLDGAWYVSFIVFMYLAAPYLYSCIYRDDDERRIAARAFALAVGSVLLYWLAHKYALDLFSNVEIGLARVHLFLAGLYVGHHVKAGRSLSSRGMMLFVGASLLWDVAYYAFVRSWGVWWGRFAFSFGGIVWCAIMASCFQVIECLAPKIMKCLRGGLAAIGSCSLELYCTHLVLFYGSIECLPRLGTGYGQLFIYVTIAIAWSLLCVRFIEPALMRCFRRVVLDRIF